MNDNADQTPSHASDADNTAVETTVNHTIEPTDTVELPVEGAPATTAHSTDDKKPADKPTRKNTPAIALALLALLLALLAGVGCAYLYYRLHTLTTANAEQAAQQKNRIDQLDVRPRLATLSKRLDGIAKQNQQNGTNSNTRIDQLQNAVQVLQETGLRSDRTWVIAETRYLLKMAQHRLLLAADLDSAAAASRVADAQLHRLADVSLLPVREALSIEIATLRSAPRPDIEGVVLALMQLGRRSNLLALPTVAGAKPATTAVKETSTEQTDEPLAQTSIGDNLVQLVKRHIVVKAAPKPTLSPENPRVDEQVLGQRAALQLALQRAQIAALRRNQVDFLAVIHAAQTLLAAHFAKDNQHVQRFSEDLDTLAQVLVRPQLKGIGAALKLLDKIEAGLGDKS